jgi:Cys-rich protein (TIGR01571 family)
VGSIQNTVRESFTPPSDGQTGSRSVSGIQQVNSFQNNSDITSVAPYCNPGSKTPQAPASPTKKPPLAPSNETDYHKRLRAREVELLENASVSSVLTTPSIEQNQVATTESLARKQLMAELKEASTLMAESQTPEAAEFWKNHVISLQARLRSLHYDEGNDQERAISPPRRPAPEPQPKPNPAESKEEMYASPTYGPASFNTEFFHPSMSPNGNLDHNSPYSKSQVRSSPYTTPVPDVMPSPYSHASNTSKQQEMGGDLVEVLAPADLPAGFQFEAELEGHRFLATVPYGGVKKGDTFSCVMREIGPQGPTIPVGGWRDRLCDCTKFGICHSVNINTIFCPLLSLGQVMTRLKLDAFGRPTRIRTDTWSSMWTITIFWIFMNVLIYLAFNYKWSNNLPLTTSDYLAVVILNLSGVIFTFSAVSATRAALREVYDIREYRFYDLEDNCCAMFCMPCTICQMHRHTAPYDQLEAHSCTKTGLRNHADLGFIESSMKPLSL